ncbi:DUF2950 domain-containing protein [Paraburkholderia sp. BCC1885]|uniref:DUF2950 domain-containing protein n=1 Tax=Paraburkholderia sp. BCC1885 TaxID=2562669 RepID=UPI0016432891|nr:DUF2950 domain-containing protein [Paraburkholderia sp. BCC1885]
MRRLISLIVASAVSTGSVLCAPDALADGRRFTSPEQAADTLAAAWQSDKPDALLAIFGRGAENLVRSGDPVAERVAREKLASAYADEHHLETVNSREVVIVLGKDAWPYPIPLVRQGTDWTFDVKAGGQQIVDRRVGRNETNAIAVCRAYVEAQRDYALGSHRDNGQHEYAQRVASTEGMHDGLYWQRSAGDEESPLGPLVAKAEAQGYGPASAAGRAAFDGYYYRILTRQGKNVPGGARNYVVDGHLTGGFALVAFPAKYGDSGVMTFVVNQHGIVFEKNLGPNTSTIARHMTQYNPDQTWSIVKP